MRYASCVTLSNFLVQRLEVVTFEINNNTLRVIFLTWTSIKVILATKSSFDTMANQLQSSFEVGKSPL